MQPNTANLHSTRVKQTEIKYTYNKQNPTEMKVKREKKRRKSAAIQTSVAVIVTNRSLQSGTGLATFIDAPDSF